MSESARQSRRGWWGWAYRWDKEPWHFSDHHLHDHHNTLALSASQIARQEFPALISSIWQSSPVGHEDPIASITGEQRRPAVALYAPASRKSLTLFSSGSVLAVPTISRPECWGTNAYPKEVTNKIRAESSSFSLACLSSSSTSFTDGTPPERLSRGESR